MTSDAKIGLLLGLVFIFVIAFIINGLPNLRPQTSRAEVLTNENTVVFPDRGLVDQESNPVVEPQVPQVEAEAVQAAMEQVVPPADTTDPQPQAETAENPDVRFVSPLPTIENPLARIKSLLQDITAGQAYQSDQTTTVNMNVPTAATEPPAVQTPSAPADVRPAETVARGAEQSKPAQPPFVKPAGKIYVVEDGESLSSLAKRAYGVEEGNRIVNVNRIFEANRDILNSPDEVKVGQKLVVPPPVKSTVNPNNPSDVLPADLFERVQALRKPASTPTAAQTPAPPAAPKVETRWYTVQDGDNLWRIASSQLGAGARYEEIAKLNADLLKDAAKLDLGMKIRLPLK